MGDSESASLDDFEEGVVPHPQQPATGKLKQTPLALQRHRSEEKGESTRNQYALPRIRSPVTHTAG